MIDVQEYLGRAQQAYEDMAAALEQLGQATLAEHVAKIDLAEAKLAVGEPPGTNADQRKANLAGAVAAEQATLDAAKAAVIESDTEVKINRQAVDLLYMQLRIHELAVMQQRGGEAFPQADALIARGQKEREQAELGPDYDENEDIPF